jgi:thiol-disulfide isomerase/thioredoxin
MLALIALVAAAAHAQETSAKLKAGSDAPPLSIAKWVKGDAVTFEKGRIYVVEFWATWCAPCILGMPHMNELQEQYKDKVTFIGVTSEDPNGNTLEAVLAMVKDDVPAMAYAVAWDDAGKTNAAYMQAAGQGGIPCSFVVDGNGRIAYIGHPVALDFVLARLVAGTWDPAKDAAELGAALRKGGEIFGMDRAIALQQLPAFEKEHPEVAVAFETAKFHLLLLAGKPEASAVGMKLMEKGLKHRNPMLLNQVAWSIVDPESDVPSRDLDLAMKAAEKAVEFSKGDAAILDTLARVHYLKGDLNKAIEIQTKAVEKAEGQMLMPLQETLEQYRAEAASKPGDAK